MNLQSFFQQNPINSHLYTLYKMRKPGALEEAHTRRSAIVFPKGLSTH